VGSGRMTTIRLTHVPSGTLLAEGPKGFGGITPFEGNFYIRRKFLRTDALKINGIPGLCPYKFLYVWMDLKLEGRDPTKYLGWLYWLPNPLMPFIWWRVALPGNHPEVLVEEVEEMEA
jgi:uncharacterized protein (DUF427 family)